ncbi:MAG TPA: tannase/feruloyl esterase family alpha/beta hydrolase [Burkholderiales bacterium]|nr:tannase/feruloyl esterase family alpha/beta hydrolase [Burkholderiales bacterium]
MRKERARLISIPVLFGFALIAAPASAHTSPPPVSCAELATDPANGLAGNPDVKSATSKIVSASGANVAFCQVDILFGTNPNQNINIRVGLPLNARDGGTGGVQGAWNGRTQGIGGGGCAGVTLTPTNNPLAAQVNAGYVGSGTDAGHTGGDCEPGVNTDGTYNLQFINDFIRNGIKEQILFSKAVAARYYGTKPAYNYWNGCSTGGRQGYLLAQELPKELDGILANAPAIYWTRFQTAQMWGQIAMKDLVGSVVSSAKIDQTNASAVAACDAADGVTDGVIDDPRTCKFSATANICGVPGAPATNCLTPQEAAAIDKIWDGPRNADGRKIWFGLDHGTPQDGFGLNGTPPFALGVTQFHWNEHDRNFDWHTVTMGGYAQVAQDGSRNIADVTDTFGNLDAYRRSGGKLLTFVGGNDQLIYPRGVINYYRLQAAHVGHSDDPDFDKLQKFYRLFRAPGVGHCGGGVGPQPQNLFGALVDWVENGKAPKTILATTTGAGGAVTRSRPLCPYPQTAIYNGTGSTDDAANFHCGGNLERKKVVCADVLVKYKHEVDGRLDFEGSGLDKCEPRHGHHHDRDDDDHDHD